MEETQIKCFCCLKILKWEKPCDPLTLSGLYGGLWFQASGNYGSTIFDPMQIEEYIRVAICDECVTKRQEHATHIFNIRRRTESKAKPWETENE